MQADPRPKCKLEYRGVHRNTDANELGPITFSLLESEIPAVVPGEHSPAFTPRGVRRKPVCTFRDRRRATSVPPSWDAQGTRAATAHACSAPRSGRGRTRPRQGSIRPARWVCRRRLGEQAGRRFRRRALARFRAPAPPTRDIVAIGSVNVGETVGGSNYVRSCILASTSRFAWVPRILRQPRSKPKSDPMPRAARKLKWGGSGVLAGA